MIYQLQQFRVAYTTHRWVRTVTSTTLLVYVIALYWLPGGFPPWAWRVLFQVVPTLPRLWAVRGIAFVFPFVILLLYSLSLLVLWGVLLLAFVKTVRHWWQGRQSLGSGTRQAARMAAQETARRGATNTGGRTQRPPSSAPLATASNPGMIPLTSKNNTNGQLISTRSPALSKSQPVLLSTGYQRRDQREQADRSLIEAQPSPLPSTQSFYERTADSQCGGEALTSNNGAMLPGFSLPSNAAYPHEVPPLQPGNTVYLHIGGESDPGLTRNYAPNEDTILVIQESHVAKGEQFPIALLAVADGMGGHADGQQASQTAISVLRDTLLPVLRSGEASDMACIEFLHIGVQRANAALYEYNQTHTWMGTTVTAALVFGTTAHIVNVGDSRTYLYRPSQGLSRATRDHSLVEELVAAELIEPDDVYTHPYRNQLTRCMGNKAEVEIDSCVVSLQVGDVLLLCSDGLWEMVRDPDIEELVVPSPRDAQHLSELLIQAALNRGGKDNVSVIVVEVAGAA